MSNRATGKGIDCLALRSFKVENQQYLKEILNFFNYLKSFLSTICDNSICRFLKKISFLLKSYKAWAIIHGVDDKEVSDKGIETLPKNRDGLQG
jgi:hypothetical protein